MIELSLANRILTEVIVNDVNFKKALKIVLTNETKKYSSIVSALVGCELRHHLLFERIIKSFEVELNQEEKHLIELGLANSFFVKKLPNDKVAEYIKNCLKDKYTKIIEQHLYFNGSISNVLDSKVDKKSLEYISIRFNTPSWLVKMWGRHFGISNSFKMMKANNLPSKTFVRVNPDVEKHPSLYDLNIFEQTEVKDVYLYKGNLPTKKVDAIVSGSVFVINKEIVKLLDKYLDSLTNEYCLFSYSDDSIVEELLTRSRKEKGIYLAVNDCYLRPELLKRINSKEIRNVSMFTYKDKFSLQASISRKQEFMIINPISSSFNKIRLYPDYLIHFKQDSIDQILKSQKQALDEMSEYLCSGGTLIYYVDTMNNKEGTLQIKEFLKTHGQFELIEEKQCLTFDETNCGCYYAVLKRN